MSEYSCFLFYCIDNQDRLCVFAIRLKPSLIQNEAIKYFAEPDSKPVLKEMLPEPYRYMPIVRIEELYEIVDMK